VRFVGCFGLLRRSRAIFAFDPIVTIVAANCAAAADANADRAADCF